MGNVLEPQDLNLKALIFGQEHQMNPQQNLFTFNGLSIDSRFESGSLMLADQAGPRKYHLWIAPDCYKTDFETKTRVWFYFKVSDVYLNAASSSTIDFTIVNMNKLEYNNYNEGMVPVYRSSATDNQWAYLPTPLKNLKVINDATIQITFEYTFTPKDNQNGVYFAFTFPYTHADCLTFLSCLETSYAGHPSIYLQRALLVYSLEGRRLDLLTITAKEEEMEPKYYNPLTPIIPNLDMIDPSEFNKMLLSLRSCMADRFSFKDKKYILLSARVHAAESPGSFMLQGFLKSLLAPDDPVSQILLQKFVFIVVPMLNPDGVFRGHYRTDIKGRDLNRTYHKVSQTPEEFPGPFAITELAKCLAKDNRLALYIDFHAHSNRNSGFILGSYSHDKKIMDEMKLFARVLDIYSKNFNYNCCKFGTAQDLQNPSIEGMSSGIIRDITGILHSYILEVSYHRTTKDPNRYDKELNTQRDLKKIVPKRIGIADFEEIGQSLRHTILEVLLSNHPSSILQNTWYEDVESLRSEISSAIPSKESL